MKGPFPITSPFGDIGRTGAPLAYLIDPGAGSASDRVQRSWPLPYLLTSIYERGGEITPLYARPSAHADELIARVVAEVDHQMDNYLPAPGEGSAECRERRLLAELTIAIEYILNGEPSP